MMTLFWILLYAPAVLLLLRAFTSKDPAWMRGLAFAAAAASVLLPLAVYALRLDISLTLSLALVGAAALYLLAWSLFSRDPAPARFTSLGVALAGAFPLFMLYQFGAHYTE